MNGPEAFAAIIERWRRRRSAPSVVVEATVCGTNADMVVPKATFLDGLSIELSRPLSEVSDVSVRCISLRPHPQPGSAVSLARLLCATPVEIATKVLTCASLTEPLRSSLREALDGGEFDDEAVHQLGLVHRSMKAHVVPRLKLTPLDEGDMMRFAFSEPVVVRMALLGTERARVLRLDAMHAAIEASEQRGQTEFVESDVLPCQLEDATGMHNPERFEQLGFVLGDIVADDPLFRYATLPTGWRKQRTEHPMWSHIVDERGRVRVRVFYKAAFYDRRADAHLVVEDT